MIFYALIVCAAILFVGSGIVWRRRTYAKILRAHLEKHGFQLVSVTIPGVFDTGPFPKVSVKIGPVSTRLLGVLMSHFEHRFVRFKDPAGTEHEAWARMFIHLFGLQEIIWKPELSEFKET